MKLKEKKTLTKEVRKKNKNRKRTEIKKQDI
jgi:hypothetical protein